MGHTAATVVVLRKRAQQRAQQYAVEQARSAAAVSLEFSLKRRRERTRLRKLEKAEHVLQQAEDERVAEWAQKYDKNGTGLLERSEMSSFLEIQLGRPPADKGLDFLLARMGALPDDAQITAAVEPGVPIRRTLQMLDKYSAYVQEQDRLDGLMAAHDADGSGELTREQLLPLLQELAPERSRRVTLGDADFVISQCQRSGTTGVVPRDELGMALAHWQRLLAEEKRDKEQRRLRGQTQTSSGGSEQSEASRGVRICCCC